MNAVRKEIWGKTYLILPCPCCGSSELYVGHQSAMTFGVECQNCRLKMEKGFPWENPFDLELETQERNALEKAIVKWNKRRAIE